VNSSHYYPDLSSSCCWSYWTHVYTHDDEDKAKKVKKILASLGDGEGFEFKGMSMDEFIDLVLSIYSEV
jgi:hypothetical protein